MASLFSTIFSALRPAQIDPRANPRKVSVVDQQGLRPLSGREQAVHVEFSADVADVTAQGLRALPPGRGDGAGGHGAPSSYATMGREARSRRTAEQWQQALGQVVGRTENPSPEAEATSIGSPPPAPPAEAGFYEAADESFVGHSWRTVMAMALRAYTRIFDPDATFSAVL